MTRRELNLLLVEAFPGLKTAYDSVVSWQDGDNTGSHVVFGDVFTPHLISILRARDSQCVVKALTFIEDVLSLEDKYADEVIAFSVLEGLYHDSSLNEFLELHMGEKTRKIYYELRGYGY